MLAKKSNFKILYRVLFFVIFINFPTLAGFCNKYSASGLIERRGQEIVFVMSKGTKNQKIVKIPKKINDALMGHLGERVLVDLYFKDGDKSGVPIMINNIEEYSGKKLHVEDEIINKNKIGCKY